MRRQTRDLHQAQDWTQGFFASLLSREAFAELNPNAGRFRSFLLAAARHFVSNERDHDAAVKRGGRIALQSLDYEDGERQLANELAHGTSPESLFERRWALALLDRVLQQLQQEYDHAGRAEQFQSLAEHLSGAANDESLAEVAERMQISEDAVRVALHRLRKRYRHLLRHEIAQTTDSAEAIEDEIRHLFQVLRQP
jgi:RNA polymerase sigma-70 factor (ECF subfamily)